MSASWGGVDRCHRLVGAVELVVALLVGMLAIAWNRLGGLGIHQLSSLCRVGC